MMQYAFFPGCVLKGMAAEAYQAVAAVTDRLGIDLVELPGWTCCGGSHAQDVDATAALAVNARNISLAEDLKLPLLTACNTCTLMLRKAKRELDHGRKEEINAILAGAGCRYQGTVRITHFMWMLLENYGLERLRSHIVRPLTGLKIAPYTAAIFYARRKLWILRTMPIPGRLQRSFKRWEPRWRIILLRRNAAAFMRFLQPKGTY